MTNLHLPMNLGIRDKCQIGKELKCLPRNLGICNLLNWQLTKIFNQREQQD
jgi:hypothetical protein